MRLQSLPSDSSGVLKSASQSTVCLSQVRRRKLFSQEHFMQLNVHCSGGSIATSLCIPFIPPGVPRCNFPASLSCSLLTYVFGSLDLAFRLLQLRNPLSLYALSSRKWFCPSTWANTSVKTTHVLHIRSPNMEGDGLKILVFFSRTFNYPRWHF